MQDRIARKHLCSICRAQYTADGGACNDCREHILGMEDIMPKKKTDDHEAVDYDAVIRNLPERDFVALHKQEPIRDDLYEAMDYDAVIRKLQKRGFSVVLQDEGDYAAIKGGQVLSVRGKTEAAAWEKLIAVKYPQGS